MTGYATLTEFTITASNWTDPLGIAEYRFYYSYDSGNIYIPIPLADPTYNFATIIFPSAYESMNVKLKCEVLNNKAITNFLSTQVYLIRKSATSAINDLGSLDTSKALTEPAVLSYQSQVN
jgi:hypothetical protein